MSLRKFSMLFFVGSLLVQILPYRLGLLPEFNTHSMYGYSGMSLVIAPFLFVGTFLSTLVLLAVIDNGENLAQGWKNVCFAGCISLWIFATLVSIHWFPRLPEWHEALGVLLLFVPPMKYMICVGKWINKKYGIS